MVLFNNLHIFSGRCSPYRRCASVRGIVDGVSGISFQFIDGIGRLTPNSVIDFNFIRMLPPHKD